MLFYFKPLIQTTFLQSCINRVFLHVNQTSAAWWRSLATWQRWGLETRNRVNPRILKRWLFIYCTPKMTLIVRVQEMWLWPGFIVFLHIMWSRLMLSCQTCCPCFCSCLMLDCFSSGLCVCVLQPAGGIYSRLEAQFRSSSQARQSSEKTPRYIYSVTHTLRCLTQ